jgi:hypothetical protein
MIGKDCWIQLKRLQEKDGTYKTYLFCQSKQRGLPCPRDVKSGKKVYELIPACFESMTDSDFMNEVFLPGLLEPRTGPGSEQMTVGEIWLRDEQMTDKEKREKELKRAETHVGK